LRGVTVSSKLPQTHFQRSLTNRKLRRLAGVGEAGTRFVRDGVEKREYAAEILSETKDLSKDLP